MPNNFAYIALILWPLISLLFLYRHMPVIQATFWTIVGGFLFLPVKFAIDFPFIPPLDKESIPVITALIGCRYIKKIKITLLPKEGIERWLILILLITPFITTLNNQESYNFIPGLTLHDAMSAFINQYLLILPFILGMQLVKTYDDQLLLFKLLVIAGLIYSVPILYEVRMSPQLHAWVYGYFPHDWLQQKRYEGFRPVVFLGHGLIVAMYVAITLGASIVLLKSKIKTYNLPPWVIVIYFLVLLLLCKSLGAIVLGLLLFVIILWMPIKVLKMAVVSIMLVFILYPFLVMLDLIPYKYIVQLVSEYDAERSRSLAFRFYHENSLLEHARNKIFFGWGGWGRHRVEGSVTDGYWIILLGKYGLFGFISVFALAGLSIWRAIKYASIVKNNNVLFYFALIISVIMLDQLPNDSLSSWMFFMIGALMGSAANIKLKSHLQKS